MGFTSALVAAMAAITSANPTVVTPGAANPVDNCQPLGPISLTNGNWPLCLIECAEFCVVPSEPFCALCMVGCLSFHMTHPEGDKFDPRTIPDLAASEGSD